LAPAVVDALAPRPLAEALAVPRDDERDALAVRSLRADALRNGVVTRSLLPIVLVDAVAVDRLPLAAVGAGAAFTPSALFARSCAVRMPSGPVP
jgi:hypothetical protein